MAALDQTHDKPKDVQLNGDGSSITMEDRNVLDKFDIKSDTTTSPDLKPESAQPTTIAGSDQFGSDAVSTDNQNGRIAALAATLIPTPQAATDQHNFDNHAYANDTDGSQSGQQLSELLGPDMVNNMYGQLKAEQRYEDEQKKNSSSERALLLADLARGYQAILRDFDKLKADVEQSAAELDGTIDDAKQVRAEFHDKIVELKELRDQQQSELANLQERAQAATDPAEKERLAAEIELKQAELDNTKATITFAVGTSNGLLHSFQETRDRMNEAKKEIEEINLKIKDAEGDPEKQQALKDQLRAAEEKYNAAKTSHDDLKKQVGVARQALDVTNDVHRQSVDCSATSEGTLAKAAAIRATTKVVEAMDRAASGTSESGSGLSQTEVHEIVTLAKEAGLDQEKFANLARDAADAGMLRREDGTRLTSDEAAAMLDAEWASLKQEQAQTDQQIAQVAGEQSQVKAEIAQDKQTIAATSSLITEKTTTGNLDSQAAAKAGVAVIGDNMSRMTNIIKDVDGNEVYADRSGAEETYYYLDQGKRVNYAENDPQVTNFRMGKDGGAAMMSLVPASSPAISSGNSSDFFKKPASSLPSSQEPVKIFANDSVDNTTYMAKFTQKEAQASVQTNEQKLSSLQNEMKSLQDKGSLIAADLQALQRIKDAQVAGTLTEEQAINELNELKKDIDKRTAAGATTTQTTSAATGARGASETLALNTPDYMLKDAANKLDEINRITATTPSDILKLKEEAEELGISPETVDNILADKIAKNELVIKENEYAQDTPENTAPAASPVLRSVNFQTLGVTVQTPTIASYTPPVAEHNILGGGYKSFADSIEFNKTNGPDAKDSPTFRSVQVANPIAATDTFGSALSRPDPAVVAAEEAERRRLAQEAALQAQELAAASRPSAGGGMSGGQSA